jgi:DNA-binding response OmpR family regulator
VSLNPARSELRTGDFRQVLTQREFQILWCLAIHEGRWLSAATLAASVLGDSSESNIESVRVHVFNLRNKLNYLSEHFQIHTARGMGYRIGKPAVH